jgi:hypothetical protein
LSKKTTIRKPFSPQPQKKENPTPQGGTKPSWGSTTPTDKAANAAAEKQKIAALQQKIAEKLKDSKALEKAAFILSSWISKTRK